MDPEQVLNYARTGLAYLLMGGIVFLGAVGVYATLVTGLELAVEIPEIFRKKIESQEELESIVIEEAKKLGLDLTKINVEYNAKRTYVTKKREECYSYIEESPTVGTVKHELYHIFKDSNIIEDMDRDIISVFYYPLIAEPRAVLYGCLGIKL